MDSIDLVDRHCGPKWTPERAIKELAEAGWQKDSWPGLWRSPWGALYRGPALAYAVMKEYPEAAPTPEKPQQESEER